MAITDEEKRRLLKAYWREVDRESRQSWQNANKYAEARAIYYVMNGKFPTTQMPERHIVPFPPECIGMTCGGKSRRTGEPCKSTQLYRNGRCKWHGGASTGPISKKGRGRSLANLQRGSKLWGL